MKVDVSLTHLSALGVLFILLVSLVQSQYEGFALSYILFCHVWLTFPGGLLSSEEVKEMEEDCRWKGVGRRGERGNYGWDFCMKEGSIFEKRNSGISGSKKRNIPEITM